MRITECEIPNSKIRNSFRGTRCTEVKTQNSAFRSDAAPNRRTQRQTFEQEITKEGVLRRA